MPLKTIKTGTRLDITTVFIPMGIPILVRPHSSILPLCRKKYNGGTSSQMLILSNLSPNQMRPSSMLHNQWIMHTTVVLSCFAVYRHGSIPPISFRITSLAIYPWFMHIVGAHDDHLVVGSANENRCNYVIPSVFGRAHTQNDPWYI